MDPVLIFAIADTESHFNAHALSKVGAIGLMQIMPQTGEWIAAMLGMSKFRSEDLFDPDLNLRFGCFYLSYLSTLFSEEWQVVASYNAGEGKVKEWIAEEIVEDTIPFEETRAYCIKVKRAKAYYKDKKYVGFD